MNKSQEIHEYEKFKAVIHRFTERMLDRFSLCLCEGKKGWDNPENVYFFISQAEKKLNFLKRIIQCNEELPVERQRIAGDIANYMAFIFQIYELPAGSRGTVCQKCGKPFIDPYAYEEEQTICDKCLTLCEPEEAEEGEGNNK